MLAPLIQMASFSLKPFVFFFLVTRTRFSQTAKDEEKVGRVKAKVHRNFGAVVTIFEMVASIYSKVSIIKPRVCGWLNNPFGYDYLILYGRPL